MGVSNMIEIGPAPKKATPTRGWDNLRSEVVKIFISHGDKIYGLQFMYFENEALVMGEVHGDFTGPSFNMVSLNRPLEYVTGIKGSSYADGLGSLAFQTNLRLLGPFGKLSSKYVFNSGESHYYFDLGEDRRHFGGFHGTLDPVDGNISSIGIYMNPVMELLPLADDNEKDNHVAITENVNVED